MPENLENTGRQKVGAASQPVALPDLASLGAHRPVILVADDEALIRNLVTLLLQHEGYFVLSAADGREGLELSRQYPGTIDLLITDVQMPRMNGTDLCGHLLEERPGIKVLVMSGADIREIVRQNANLLFLPKPFDGQTLKARVRAILAAPVPLPALLRPNGHSTLIPEADCDLRADNEFTFEQPSED